MIYDQQPDSCESTQLNLGNRLRKQTPSSQKSKLISPLMRKHNRKSTNNSSKLVLHAVTMNPDKTEPEIYTSRASAILRAALLDKNMQHDNKWQAQIKHFDTQRCKRIIRLNNSLDIPNTHTTPPKRRRSFANRVLFTNPVVTHSFEYESSYDNKDTMNQEEEPVHTFDLSDSSDDTEYINKFNQTTDENKMDMNEISIVCDQTKEEPITLKTISVESNPVFDTDETSNLSTASSEFHESSDGLFSSPKQPKVAPSCNEDFEFNLTPENSINLIMDNPERAVDREYLYDDHQTHSMDLVVDDDVDEVDLHKDKEEQAGYLSWLSYNFSNIKLALRKFFH